MTQRKIISAKIQEKIALKETMHVRGQ